MSFHSHFVNQNGEQYIDVNCKSQGGMTPLLLVTKDISLFEKGTYVRTTHMHTYTTHICTSLRLAALHSVRGCDTGQKVNVCPLMPLVGSRVDSCNAILRPVCFSES